MRTKQVGLAALFLTVFAALMLAIAFGSKGFDKCLADQYQSYDAAQHNEITNDVLAPIAFRAICFAAFFGDNSDAVTAISTLIIAAFTATLWRASRAQGKIALTQTQIASKQTEIFSRQAEIFEQQMIYEHGPRIRVVEVVLVGHLEQEKPIRAAVSLLNIGASDAKIISGNITVTVGKVDTAPWRSVETDREVSDPYVPPFDFFLTNPAPPKGTWLEAGEQTLPVSRERRLYLQLPEWLAIGEGHKAVWVVGFVFYQDKNGRKRKTGFCRQLTKDGTRFRTFADPDLEYEF